MYPTHNTCIHTHAYTHMHAHTCVHTCIYTHAYTHAYTHMHTHMHIHMHIHTCIRTHAYTHQQLLLILDECLEFFASSVSLCVHRPQTLWTTTTLSTSQRSRWQSSSPSRDHFTHTLEGMQLSDLVQDTCVYTDTHTCTHMHAHTHAPTHTDRHMCTHMHARTHTHRQTHVHTHAHTHTHPCAPYDLPSVCAGLKMPTSASALQCSCVTTPPRCGAAGPTTSTYSSFKKGEAERGNMPPCIIAYVCVKIYLFTITIASVQNLNLVPKCYLT